MQQLLLGVLVAILYLTVTGVLSGAVARATTQTTPVWLAAGVLFSALLVCARWSWPAVLVGAGISSGVWGVIAHQLGLAPSLPFGLIEVVSMGVGGWIATLGRHDPQRPIGAALMIVGAVVGASLGGLLAVELWRSQRPGADLFAEWLTWTLSTGVGMLVMGPLAVAFRGFRVKRSGGMPMRDFLGGTIAFLAFLIAAFIVFGNNVADRFGNFASTLAYVPMPFLLIATLLWGARGGAVATLLGAVLIVWRTAHGGGPFAITESFRGEAVVEVQGFVAAWAAVLLLARALSEDRTAALVQARSWRLRYERMLRAVGVASVEYDIVTGRATWGDGAGEVLGSVVDSVGSIGEWLDHVDAAERGLAVAAWNAVSRGDVSTSEQEYAVKLGSGETFRVKEQLAAVRGADGEVEQVVAMLRRVPVETVP